MIRNEFNDTTIASEDVPSLPTNVSTYKIGYTTYIVETHFNLDCKESLDDVISRLIIKDVTKQSI